MSTGHKILQSINKEQRFRGRPATAATVVTEEELKAEIPSGTFFCKFQKF